MSQDFFRAVPEIAKRYGTVVLLDQVVTGFREAAGGWQSVVGIRPDLTSIGKAVSGGMAAGALVGRADLMAALSPDAPPGRGVRSLSRWRTPAGGGRGGPIAPPDGQRSGSEAWAPGPALWPVDLPCVSG